MLRRVETACQFDAVRAWIVDRTSEPTAPLAFPIEAPREARGENSEIAIDVSFSRSLPPFGVIRISITC
jgi:hypothetical protein